MRRESDGVVAEELMLDLVDVVLEPRHHRGVLVDDLVEDGVEDRLGPETQQLGVLLEPVAHRGEVR